MEKSRRLKNPCFSLISLTGKSLQNFPLVTGRSLQNGKMSMGNRHTERPPDPVLYGGRRSGSFVNRAVRPVYTKCQRQRCNNSAMMLLILFSLPPANEVRSKVMFLHMSIILSTGGFFPACMTGNRGGGLHPGEGVCIQGVGGSPSIGEGVCIQCRSVDVDAWCKLGVSAHRLHQQHPNFDCFPYFAWQVPCCATSSWQLLWNSYHLFI